MQVYVLAQILEGISRDVPPMKLHDSRLFLSSQPTLCHYENWHIGINSCYVIIIHRRGSGEDFYHKCYPAPLSVVTHIIVPHHIKSTHLVPLYELAQYWLHSLEIWAILGHTQQMNISNDSIRTFRKALLDLIFR